MMFSEKESSGKGGLGGHASNQPPVVIDTPVVYKYSPVTNADRVRAMTDEELAGILAMQSVVSPPWCAENYDCPYADQDPVRCDLCALDWLKEEAAPYVESE